MLDTFIKNRGITKTIIHSNNKNQTNTVNWDADYDGKKANISLEVNNDGEEEHYNVQLTNSDLAKILSLNSVNKSLDERLLHDFKKTRKYREKKIKPMIIEFESKKPYRVLYENENECKDDEYDKITDLLLNNEKQMINQRLLLDNNKQLKIPNKLTHISSPLQNEELIVPLTIDDLNLTPRTRNRRRKSHKIHKVYKIYKPLTRRRRRRRY